MSDNDTQIRVQTILSDHLGLPIDEITGGAVLGDDLSADSLDIVELEMALEEEFSIIISDDDLTEAMTVDAVCALIQSKLV